MSQQRYPYRGQMNMAEPISRPRAGYVDFSIVPERHQEMHARLENWGRSCNGGQSSDMSPMFRQFVAAKHWDGAYCQQVKEPCDRADALKVGRAVLGLPEPHRIAMHWYYVQRTSVMQGRRMLRCTAEALSVYVTDARQMLVNRGA